MSEPEWTPWPGCCEQLCEAVERFNLRAKPFSMASKRYHLSRLIKEEVDPVLVLYSHGLSQTWRGVGVPGLDGGEAFSAFVRKHGVGLADRLLRWHINQAVKIPSAQQSEEGQCFIATAETLRNLLVYCRVKRPKRSHSVRSKLNQVRPRELCRFCGEPTEFWQAVQNEARESELDPDELLRLSHKYCPEHRPRLPGGEWNSEYLRAKRSKASFDMEAARLSRHTSRPAQVVNISGNRAVDRYLNALVLGSALQPADEDRIRQLARRLVDYRISDRKKQIILSLALGLRPAEIARQLKVSRQAVSKAIATIPAEFRFDVTG